MNKILKLHNYCKDEMPVWEDWLDLFQAGFTITCYLCFVLLCAIGFGITWPVSFLERIKSDDKPLYWIGLFGIYFVFLSQLTYIIYHW